MASQQAHVSVTVLSGGKATSVARARTTTDDVWLTLADLTAATGWEFKPEGMCRDEVCIPLTETQAGALVMADGADTWLNLTGFARSIGQPFASDASHGVWSFGPPPYEWQRRIDSVMAPDFTLNDFQGKPHTLSDYRGKKVFLVTWASW